jgi:transposase
LAFLLTGGQAADCRVGALLLQHVPPGALVIADRAYNTDAIRRLIEVQGAVPNLPSKMTRRWKNCFSKVLYRDRNAIERMFGRIPRSQCHRTHVRSPQGLPKDRNQIRQTCDQLPCRDLPRCHHLLLVMSPESRQPQHDASLLIPWAAGVSDVLETRGAFSDKFLKIVNKYGLINTTNVYAQ